MVINGEDKIVVHCPDEGSWNSVSRAIGFNIPWNNKGHDTYINTTDKLWGSGKDYMGLLKRPERYKIINVDEFFFRRNEHPKRIVSVSKKNNHKTKESNMNATIRKIFKDDTLELAEKVNKYFGSTIAENFTGEIILRAYKEDYIAEAKRLEDEELKKEK